MADLRAAWRRFVDHGEFAPGVRRVVREAWARCRAYGLDPERIAPQTPDPRRLAAARAANRRLLEVVDPLLRSIDETLRGVPHIIALADADGMILRLVAHPVAEALGNVFEGASWAERDVGCNAVGTALVTKAPVLLIGPEHFAANDCAWTCIGVPLRGGNGAVAGVLDLSVPNEHVEVRTWGWILSVGRSIEARLTGGIPAVSDAASAAGDLSGSLDNPFHAPRGAIDLFSANSGMTATHRHFVAQATDAIDLAEERLRETLRQEAEARGRLQEALRIAEDRSLEWEALFESVSDPILVAEAPARLVAVNRAGLEMLGASSLEDVQSNLAFQNPRVVLMFPDGSPVPTEERPLVRALRGESFVNVPFRFIGPDGREMDHLVSGGPVRRGDDAPRRAITIVRNVTELRRLERARAHFLRVIAHELRNPLTAARGLVAVGCRALAADRQARVGEYLSLANEELTRLSELVNEIVDGLRVDSGRLSIERRRVNLVDVLDAALAPYRLGVSERELIVAPPPRPEIPVSADAGRIAQVLKNLLSNAVKYSPARSRVWVSAVVTPKHVTIRVEDEGFGIPSDQLEQVFRGFHRASNTGAGAEDPGGLGLGLYISRDIARRHDGDLWAENRPGGGTVMCLRLPSLSPGEELAEAG